LLLAPGSSLGGAPPKASVHDKDGHLAIATFPRRDDDYNTVVWEAIALTLAHKAGIPVPDARIETVGDKPVLVLRRFDRRDGRRIPFLSSMSMLDARDSQTRSYMEIADGLRQHGAAAKDDIRELWRRIVFNVLISNTDDYLRNHGFLYEGPAGWWLSPAYDLNPVPVDIKPRILTTAINEDDNTASLDVAMSVAHPPPSGRVGVQRSSTSNIPSSPVRSTRIRSMPTPSVGSVLSRSETVMPVPVSNPGAKLPRQSCVGATVSPAARRRSPSAAEMHGAVRRRSPAPSVPSRRASTRARMGDSRASICALTRNRSSTKVRSIRIS
jgi:hypothetical protein